MTLGPAIVHLEVAALDISVRAHPFEKGGGVRCNRCVGGSGDKTDPSRQLVQCLGERWERRYPRRDRRAAEQRDELAALDHSITSSARASSVAGMSRPNDLAVRRLTINSNRVACSMGRSAGFV